jgi:excisionase family DNA binding protein
MKSSLTLAEVGDVLTPDELSRIFGIGRNATYDLLASGRLPSIRVTERRIIVTKQAVEAFLLGSSKSTSAGTPEKACA